MRVVKDAMVLINLAKITLLVHSCDYFEKVINIDVMMCYEFMRFTTQKTNFED